MPVVDPHDAKVRRVAVERQPSTLIEPDQGAPPEPNTVSGDLVAVPSHPGQDLVHLLDRHGPGSHIEHGRSLPMRREAMEASVAEGSLELFLAEWHIVARQHRLGPPRSRSATTIRWNRLTSSRPSMSSTRGAEARPSRSQYRLPMVLAPLSPPRIFSTVLCLVRGEHITITLGPQFDVRRGHGRDQRSAVAPGSQRDPCSVRLPCVSSSTAGRSSP
jgi:hypothetical protein